MCVREHERVFGNGFFLKGGKLHVRLPKCLSCAFLKLEAS